MSAHGEFKGKLVSVVVIQRFLSHCVLKRENNYVPIFPKDVVCGSVLKVTAIVIN